MKKSHSLLLIAVLAILVLSLVSGIRKSSFFLEILIGIYVSDILSGTNDCVPFSPARKLRADFTVQS